MITNEHIQQFLAQAHRVGDAKLTICSSGNLSWRIGEEALVSGTGSWVPNLQAEKVSICKVATGEVMNGVKPSMESGFHLGILRERPDVNVVLHFQSKYATAVACMKQKPTNFNVKDHDSILLTNHGQVVCGKDFDEVFERAMFFEMACRIIVQAGGDYSVLTPQDIEDLDIYVLGKKTK